jgi:hypothetical protein
VVRVSTKGCRVGHGVGGGEGEKVAVAARESGRRLQEASFPTNLARVGVCGP